MTLYLTRLLLAALLLLPVAPTAQAATLNDVVQAVEGPFRSGTIRDYSATFAQESRIAALDRAQQAGGAVLVRFTAPRKGENPGVMFRWHYEKPAVQELVCDGKTLWVYLPENNQLIISPVDSNTPRENDPLAFLTGLGNLSRDFTVSFAAPERDEQGNYRIELQPRRPSPVLERMTIAVSREAVEKGNGTLFPVAATTVVDPSGNTTTISFSDVRVNRGLGAERFTFVAPAGVEVVRPGE